MDRPARVQYLAGGLRIVRVGFNTRRIRDPRREVSTTAIHFSHFAATITDAIDRSFSISSHQYSHLRL
jgi:hypothetical protein